MVKILLRDKCAFPVLRVSSKISWTQLEESRITIPLARKVISDLDMEVATLVRWIDASCVYNSDSARSSPLSYRTQTQDYAMQWLHPLHACGRTVTRSLRA